MTTNGQANPFNITKAVDFSDQDIKDYWVDIDESGGFSEMAKLTSAVKCGMSSEERLISGHQTTLTFLWRKNMLQGKKRFTSFVT